jgi:hypothetical protein
MYFLNIVIRHCSDLRVSEACQRISDYVLGIRHESIDFSIEEPDEFNEDYFARGAIEIPNRDFVRVVTECLKEEYCSVRLLFEKKAYGLIEGSIDGNVSGATISGPLRQVYEISKALMTALPQTQREEEGVEASPAGRPELKLVE